MTDRKDTAMADYEVTNAREIGGVWRDVGSQVQMTPRQAMYYLPPYGTGLKVAAPKAVARSKGEIDMPATEDDKVEG